MGGRHAMRCFLPPPRRLRVGAQAAMIPPTAVMSAHAPPPSPARAAAGTRWRPGTTTAGRSRVTTCRCPRRLPRALARCAARAASASRCRRARARPARSRARRACSVLRTTSRSAGESSSATGGSSILPPRPPRARPAAAHPAGVLCPARPACRELGSAQPPAAAAAAAAACSRCVVCAHARSDGNGSNGRGGAERGDAGAAAAV